jgi:autotransporter-associated beta strand protein
MRTVRQFVRSNGDRMWLWATRAFGAAFMMLTPLHVGAAENVLAFAASSHIVTTTGRITTVAFTVEAWVRMTAAQVENQIVCQYVGGNAGRMLVALRNDKPALFIGGTWLDGNAVNFTNTWTHLAVTRSGSVCTLYVNGVLNKTGTVNANILSPTGITIGGLNLLNYGFRGQIADVRVWNVARSSGEIAASMHSRLAGDETGLIHYWRLDEGAGTLAHDRSAASATGTISGATWSISDLPIVSDTPEGAWASAIGGNWSAPANWLNGTVASGTDAVALFTNQPPAAVTVNNDVAGLRLGSLVIDGTHSHTFIGNALSLTNRIGPSSVLAAGGEHEIRLPLNLSSFGASVATLFPASLTVSEPISGTGGLFVNPAASGGGTVAFPTANTFSGPVALGCGTLLFETADDAPLGASSGDPDNFTLGPGTLKFTGATVALDRGFTVAAGASPVRAAVLHAEGDVTVNGAVAATSGSFVKSGPGTVTFAYPGLNTFSRQDGNPDAVLNTGTNGDSPTTGFSAFTVADGTVVFDAAGQTNTVNGRVTVGLCTTTNANSETAAELVVNDGVFACSSSLCIGRNNGTAVTAGPDGVVSRMTVNGGHVQGQNIAIGLHLFGGLTGYNGQSVCDINGGIVETRGYVAIAEDPGLTGTVNVHGGTLLCPNPSHSEGLRIGSSRGAGDGFIHLFGGVVDVQTDVGLAVFTGARGTLNLHGGTLIARNITKTTGDYAEVLFNGGTYMPRSAGKTLAGLDFARVSTNGVRIDTSLADYTVAQALLHDAGLGGAPDGGLVKLGTNTLTFAATGSTYTGPTVVSNGMLRLAASLPSGSLLTVAPAGEALAGGSATQAVSVGGIALAAGGTLGFAFAADGSSNDRLAVATSPSLGSGRIALYLKDTELPFTRNGTYTLLTYSGSNPDTSDLAMANPVFGKTYTLQAAGGALTVTIASSPAGASVWTHSAGGDWGAPGNWTTAPTGAAGDRVRFDDAIAAPATVATANETVGEIYFNNALAGYTLGGLGLTLDNDGVSALISIESGAHAVTAPLALAGGTVLHFAPSTALTLGAVDGATAALSAEGDGTLTLTAAPEIGTLTLDVPALATIHSMTVTPSVALRRTVTMVPAADTAVTLAEGISGSGGLTKAGSSTLTPAAANTYTGPTTLGAGTLVVNALADGGSASAIGASPAAAANLVLGPGTLRYTGPSNEVNRGYTLHAGGSPIRAALMHVTEHLAFGGQVLSSSGAFIKTGPGTLRYTYPGQNTLCTHQSANPFSVQNTGANGDGPTVGFAGYNINEGTVVMGVPGQTNIVNGRLLVGLQTTTAANAETSGELIVNDGVVACNNNIGIAWNNGTAVTAGPEGTRSRIVVNGGTLKGQVLSAGLNNQSLVNFNARPRLVLNGGAIELSNSLILSETSGAVSRADINGGLFKVTGNTGGNSIRIGGTGTATFAVRSNAVVDAVSTVRLAESAGANSKGLLSLEGGTLTAPNILKGSGTEAILRFNGGTFRPRTANQTMSGLTAVYVSTNGAALDTTLADGYTIAQNLSTDPELAGLKDGGLLKLGTNALSLTSAANTFNGPVRVNEGLLRARLGGTNDLSVAGGAAFDALGERATVGDLSGSGLLTNGVVAVTGRLDAGTNGAPAGASLTVQNLAFAAGSTLACDWTTNALGQLIHDFVTVTGTLAPEGPGFFDLGRTPGDPVPLPFELTVMSYGTLSGAFAGWKAVNTGLPDTARLATVVRAADGSVTLRIQYGGTLVLIN